MRSGELFAGVGGLGMAVDRVFGSRPSWFCEFDTAPSKVLAYYHPDVPNYGDVTKVDWATAPRVQILAGGFPCQDVSLAGRRKGMGEGTRSGLWSEFAKAIDEIRPDWVVIENVRGLLSADANSNMEPCPLCVGDDPRHVLRALGAVLGDLAELGFDAEWTGIRASDVGAPHGRFRVFILAWPSERTAADSDSRRRGIGKELDGDQASHSSDGDSRGEHAPRRAGAEVKLLSTPDTVPEAPNTGSNSHKAGNIVGLGNQVLSLLPTPGAYDGDRGGSQHPDKRRAGNHSVTLQDVAEHRLLPTPTASEGAKGGPNQAYGSGGATLSGTVPHLFPTPRASRGGSATETMYGLGAERVDDERSQGQVVADVTDWGPYEAAIRRWEATLGRPAPAPVRFDGKGGKPRLNPELTEWMMGWPAGHVTDPTIGLTRAEQLKACGNGVVPAQAAAALREMLARPGVPSMKETP